MTSTLDQTFIPELGSPRRGKVRDVYESGENLVMIASDRISIFDQVLNRQIPDKGRVLTELSMFWFDCTKDLVPNHLVSHPDPNVMVVRSCRAIEAEIIVRGYVAGSLARDYSKGMLSKCGITLPPGLKEGDPLPKPIVTPTTKSEHDEDITSEELIKRGVVSNSQWSRIEKLALSLYARGQKIAKEKGLILVDTKYEFGIDTDGDIVLIDEIHTPDSSRYWFESEYERKQLRYPDKEFVRQWGIEKKDRTLPEKMILEASDGYRQVYQALTGVSLTQETGSVPNRLLSNLCHSGLIKGCFCVVLAGSEKDQPHVDKITRGLQQAEIPYSAVVSSAHKNTRAVIEMIEQYEKSIEPVVWITVAGRSNALSGVVAANSRWPVIACPPFKDKSDYLVNIHSTLQMPSKVPVMTVLEPENAALAAERILNLN